MKSSQNTKLPNNPHMKRGTIPWTIIKPSKPYKMLRPNTITKSNPPLQSTPSTEESKPSEATQQTDQIVSSCLPFLKKTSINLNEDEISMLNEILCKERQSNLSTLSRLQQIKLTRIESSSKPPALDLDKSAPYIVPTESGSIPLDLVQNFERENSQLLINDDDLSSQIQIRTSLTSAAPTAADLSEMANAASMSAGHEPVSIDDVKDAIWLYCHSFEQKSEVFDMRPFEGKIVSKNKKVILNDSVGRKKLISAINYVADSSHADYCERVPEQKIDRPIERTFTAKKFSLFLKNRNVKVPFYLKSAQQY